MRKDIFFPLLKKILLLLAEKQYNVLAEMDYEQNMKADYMENVIEEYGGQLTIPDDDIIIDQMEVFDTENPARFYIDSPIWIDHERSDLTLSLVIIEVKKSLKFTLKDIHIL